MGYKVNYHYFKHTVVTYFADRSARLQTTNRGRGNRVMMTCEADAIWPGLIDMLKNEAKLVQRQKY